MKKLLTMIGAAAVVASVALSSWAATWNGVSSGFTSDGDNWIEGTAPATGNGLSFTNTTGRTLYVTNDISYKLGDTTVVDGAWEFAGTETFYPGNALLMGDQGKTVSIVNYADWNCDFYFAIANESNSTVVFTNRAGTIRCKGNGSSSSMPGVTIGGRYNQETKFTGTSGKLVFEGGTLTCAKAFEVGYGKNCAGVFEQTGGTITAGRLSIAKTTGASGTVLLKGGTFAAQYVAVGSGTGGSLTFDGGTLRLTSSHSAAIQASSKLAINVGANGGTISLASGVASTIPADISSALASGTDGGLRIIGGGALTFTGTLSYTGATTVEAGTTIAVNDSTSKANILANGIRVTGAPVLNTAYTVVTFDEKLAESDLANVTCDVASSFTKAIGTDGKSIVVTCTVIKPAWYIGPADGDLGTAANWSDGVVPTSGNAVISSAAAATLTSSAAFTPDAITFPADSALITINGEDAIANLLAVTNNSALHHVFNCPVSFKANEDADICASSGSGTYVKYLGGMTMYKPKKAASNVDVYLSGQITLTAEIDDWSAYVTIDRLHLVDSGSKLTIPNSVTIKTTTPNFTLASGTTLEVQGNMTATASSCFSYANAGTMLVSGIVSSSATTWPGADSGTASGVLSARGFSTSANNGIVFHPKDVFGATLVIGSDGLGGTGNYYVQKSLSSTLKPSADYAINAPINSAGNSYSPTLTIGTSDYFDSAVGRTITVNKVIGTRYLLNVNGNGMILFNSVSTFARGISVQDSATLAVNPGMRPGNGAVTMNGTSTLKVAQSGTVTLGGKLTLTANAALAFNFTERATAPVLSASSATVSGDTVNVKVSAADGIRPKGGTHTLTSGIDFTGKTVNLVDPPDWVQSVDIVDGNLVLTVKSNGFMIIVQ